MEEGETMKLKGSKTEKNLEAAFEFESKARNKYTLFADVAKKEGFEQAARILLETAEHEMVHAIKELNFLNGVSNTEANLKAVAESEHSEGTEMYPEFERKAREEGFTEIADFFRRVTEIERQHERTYRALLKDVQKRKVFKKDQAVVWKCHHCGWLEKSLEAPNECPTCKYPQSGFEVVAEIRQGV